MIISQSCLPRSSVVIIEVFGAESLFVMSLIQREAIDLTLGLSQSGPVRSPVYSLEGNLQLLTWTGPGSVSRHN